jgi:phage terminase small subunit
MTAGRPRKPTALKLLQGNPGKRRLNESEPMPPAASLEAPHWLKAAGRRVWEELAPPVQAEGLLTVLDVELFAHACVQLAAARRSTRDKKSLDVANRILARFGFTPSDRARLNVNPRPPDPFEDFLDGNGR